MDWLPEEKDTTRPMTIRGIVCEKLYDVALTVKIYAAVLSSPKHISRIVKCLGDILPIPGLKHLKRVKRDEGRTYVILDVVEEEGEGEGEGEGGEEVGECPAKRMKLDEASYLERLKEKGFKYEEWGVVGVEVHPVPKTGPVTRAQYEKAMKYWPVNFHPEKKLEAMMSENVFEGAELEHHVTCMRYVMRKSLERRKNVALVVDSAAREFVGMGFDRGEHHPLQHAVMVAVDAVAKANGGGAWELPFEELTFPKAETPRNRSEEVVPSTGEEDTAPYLCTGYDLYVVREPCVMCAMSLVHSRIKRVFFRARDSEKGALASRCQVHTIKDLNHHYDVFEMVGE